jgi:hypothetical protein
MGKNRQSLQTGESDQSFYEFCDALEVKNGVSASAAGWGLDHALDAYGNYMKNYVSQGKSFSKQTRKLGAHSVTQLVDLGHKKTV